MEEIHFVGKVAQKALICKGDSVLIMRDVGDSDTWELPGGRLNMKEDPMVGLAREIVEELGVEVRVGDAFYLEQFTSLRTGEPHLAIVYKAFLTTTTTFNLDPQEVAEVAWVNKDTWQKYRYFAEYERALAKHFEAKLVADL